MAWTVDFNMFGEQTELQKQLNKVERAERKALSSARKKQIRKRATQARRIIEKENTVKEIVSKGVFKSSITGKTYKHRDEAYKAGERAKERAKNPKYQDEESKKYYQEELKKRQEAAEKRAEIKRIKEQNERIEQALEEMDEFEYDEDEWETVETPKEEVKSVEDSIIVYWEDVSHGIIGNPYAWLHDSGSWLYAHGFDAWDLTELIKDPYWRSSSDNHTNLEFVEVALRDSQYGIKYSVYQDPRTNEYSIVSK